MLENDIERGLLLATALMSVNLIAGFLITIISQSLQVSMIAGSWGFLELGGLLIVGGCLASRQPLENSRRYTEDGEPTSAWRMALIGRQLLFAAVMLFLYVGLISVLSYIIPF